MRGGGRWSVGACCGFDTGFVAWFFVGSSLFCLESCCREMGLGFVDGEVEERIHIFGRSHAVDDSRDAQDRIETVASA